MFITSKNAITEAITKDLVKILYVKFPLSKREKDIIKIQNSIFKYRKNSVLIFNIFYNFYKQNIEIILKKYFGFANKFCPLPPNFSTI